jgi:hypothetical protein
LPPLFLWSAKTTPSSALTSFRHGRALGGRRRVYW